MGVHGWGVLQKTIVWRKIFVKVLTKKASRGIMEKKRKAQKGEENEQF